MAKQNAGHRQRGCELADTCRPVKNVGMMWPVGPQLCLEEVHDALLA